ncbi:MAG: hypothetical protein IJH13_03115 [Bacilli bacterium]|nr:hypothetical protein [Bacilli bacterium]
MKKIRFLILLILIGIMILPTSVWALPANNNSDGTDPRAECSVKVGDATVLVRIWGKDQISAECKGTVKSSKPCSEANLSGIKHDDFVTSDKKHAQCPTNTTYYALAKLKTGGRTYKITLSKKKPSLTKSEKMKQSIVLEEVKFNKEFTNDTMSKNKEKREQEKGKYNKEAISKLEQKETTSCSGIFGSVTDKGKNGSPASLAYIFQQLFNYLKILGPLLVIILSGLDFTKTVLSGDDEGMQKATKKLGIRLVLVVLLYFIPDLAKFILSILNGGLKDPTCGIK